MVHRGEFGCMAALRGNKIVSVPLADAIAKNRTVDQETIDVASGILDKLTTDKVPVGKRSGRRTADLGPQTSGVSQTPKVRRPRSGVGRPTPEV